MVPAPTLAAIVLAGGRATRLGGVDKPLLEVGGRSLLDRAVSAARSAGAASITVVGPSHEGFPGVRWLREDPPFGGPAAALVAALTDDPAPAADWTLVLAADLVHPDEAVTRLRDAAPLLPGDTDGVCLADSGSRPQWLTGLYRTAVLRGAAAALPDAGRDAPVRDLVAEFAIAVLAAPDAVVADVDTWEDLERARAAEDTASAPRRTDSQEDS